jgi:hypothetical protein
MADPYYLPSLADGTKYATNPINRIDGGPDYSTAGSLFNAGLTLGTGGDAKDVAANYLKGEATKAGLNAVGLGSLLGPLGLFNTIKGIGDFLGARNEAERAKREAEFRAATETMQQAGFDPYQTYSPEAVQGMFDAAPEFAGLPGMDAGALSQQFIGDTIARFMRDPSAYSTVVPQAQSLAPVDYVKDVLSLPGQIWEDPSSVLGVILGPGGITGNVEWGGGTVKNAPGSAPAVYTGQVGDKVYTGASTGVPSVDAAIRRVLGQTEGGATTTRDVFEQAIEDITGFPAPAVADIFDSVFKDPGASTPSPTATTTGGTGATTTTTTSTGQTGGSGQTTDQQDKVTVGTDPGLFEKVMGVIRGKQSDKEIRDAAEVAGVSKEEIAKVLNLPQSEVDERWEGAGGPFDTSGNDTILDTTTGDTILDTTTGDRTLDVVTPDGQGPTRLDTPPTEVLDVPSLPSGGGTGGGGSAYDMLVPQFSQVDVGESPLAEIDYLYDVGGESIFAPKTGDPDEESDNLARIRRLGGIPYAQGGQVDIVELARQLLRG